MSDKKDDIIAGPPTPVEVDKPQVNPTISILGTDDGRVILRIDIAFKPHAAAKLAKVMITAAREVMRRMPIIVPGGRA